MRRTENDKLGASTPSFCVTIFSFFQKLFLELFLESVFCMSSLLFFVTSLLFFATSSIVFYLHFYNMTTANVQVIIFYPTLNNMTCNICLILVLHVGWLWNIDRRVVVIVHRCITTSTLSTLAAVPRTQNIYYMLAVWHCGGHERRWALCSVCNRLHIFRG